MSNKYTIPAVLLATILVAGGFAFSPVEKASTVHTTITDATPVPQLLTAEEGGTTVSDGQQVEVSCDDDFVLEFLSIEYTQAGTVEDTNISAVQIDENPLTDANDGSLTLIDLVDGNENANPMVVPQSINELGASSSIDFELEDESDSDDTIGPITAVVMAPSDASCLVAYNAQD